MKAVQNVVNWTKLSRLKGGIEVHTRGMNEKSIELLKYIGQNARMGTITLTALKERLPEGSMKTSVLKQLEEYEYVVGASDRKLEAAGEEAKEISGLTKTAATAMLNAQTLADKSASHIAEMIIIGSTRGVIEITRHLRDAKLTADDDCLNLGYRLLSIEKNNIDDLKHFI